MSTPNRAEERANRALAHLTATEQLAYDLVLEIAKFGISAKKDMRALWAAFYDSFLEPIPDPYNGDEAQDEVLFETLQIISDEYSTRFTVIGEKIKQKVDAIEPSVSDIVPTIVHLPIDVLNPDTLRYLGLRKGDSLNTETAEELVQKALALLKQRIKDADTFKSHVNEQLPYVRRCVKDQKAEQEKEREAEMAQKIKDLENAAHAKQMEELQMKDREAVWEKVFKKRDEHRKEMMEILQKKHDETKKQAEDEEDLEVEKEPEN